MSCFPKTIFIKLVLVNNFKTGKIRLEKEDFWMYIKNIEGRTLIEVLEKEFTDLNTGCLVIMLSEADATKLPGLSAILNKNEIKFVGGVFPKLIVDSKLVKSGMIVKKLPVIGEPMFYEDVTKFNKELCTDDFPESFFDGSKKYGALIMGEGLCPAFEPWLNKVYELLGDSCSYIGAGAGFYDLKPGKCIFNNSGCYQGAAFFMILDCSIDLAIAHGLKECFGPFAASEVKDYYELLQLAWRPAYEVYQEMIGKDIGEQINKDETFSMGTGYPLGIDRENSEKVVREFLSPSPRDGIMLGGMVPENAMVYIMKCDVESMLAAAKKVAQDAALSDKTKVFDSLIVDCISREINLGERFSEEINNIAEAVDRISHGAIAEGVLSIGEIASDAQDSHLDKHNKTIVLGYFKGIADD